MLRRLIGEDIQVVTIFSAGPTRVLADRSQLEQVIVNLAVNARDAMPQGGKLILETACVDLGAGYAGSRPEVRPGAYVLFALSDTGSGMDAETQSHLFEPFFTTKALGKGTGLGLATVYGIIKQSGGHIAVYSEIGHGTTFRVYLPTTDAAATLEDEAARPSVGGGSETILIVEDEPALREIVREMLGEAGYHALEAASPELALSLARSHPGPIQLLITDVVMPRVSGPDLAAQIRGVRPSIRTLYMSGYTSEAIGQRGLLAADTHFLEKPFAAAALVEKVRAVLDEPG
jgi:CheY-like chemotaxis protein